jgi:methanogenic corrinoid protein MtbC1
MSQADRSPDRPPSRSLGAHGLCSVVYRSRAVESLSDYQLYELVQTAQSKNAAESITGLMLYDAGRFYQWLEGPVENIGRLMRLIQTDKRHTDIEILSDKPCATRQFGDWKMRLATRGVRSIHSLNNVVVPSARELEDIHHHPDHVQNVLAGFSTISDSEPNPAPPPSNLPLQGPVGAILKDILVTAVLPEIVARHANQDRRHISPVDTRARALADLLIGADSNAAVELLRTLQDSDGAIRHLYENLLEPAARRLGDLWGADLCSELDVTLGLGQLQRAIRVLNEEVTQPTLPKGLFLPAVLIVPEPGEAHLLNSVLDADALAAAGWDPLTEFPDSDEALQDLIAGTWFDALDLSLSPAFRRDHWLPRVTKTIALARHASRNPALVVVVGGRIFNEDSAASARVGADATTRTALGTERAIRAGLDRLQGD